MLVDLDPQNDLTRGVGADASWLPRYLDLCAEKLQLNEMDEAKSILSKAIQTKKFPTSDKKAYTLSVLSADLKALQAFRDDSDVDPIQAIKKLVGLLRQDYDYVFSILRRPQTSLL